MIDIVRENIQTLDRKNVETGILAVRDLKTLHDDSFSHVSTNFGIGHSPDDPCHPAKARREMWRVLKKGGVCVVTTWSGELLLCIRALRSDEEGSRLGRSRADTCLIEGNFDRAFEKAALIVRPNEEPYSWNINEDCTKGWWLMKHLKDAGFGNKVHVKNVEGRIEAKTLDELMGNMLLFEDSESSFPSRRPERVLKYIAN